MNHKRKRPKHQRAGCIMCKPHKDDRQPHRSKTESLEELLEKTEKEEVHQSEIDTYGEDF